MILKTLPKPAAPPSAASASMIGRRCEGEREADRDETPDPAGSGELSERKAFILPAFRVCSGRPPLHGRPEPAGRAVGRGVTGCRLNPLGRVSAGRGSGL